MSIVSSQPQSCNHINNSTDTTVLVQRYYDGTMLSRFQIRRAGHEQDAKIGKRTRSSKSIVIDSFPSRKQGKRNMSKEMVPDGEVYATQLLQDTVKLMMWNGGGTQEVCRIEKMEARASEANMDTDMEMLRTLTQ